MKVITIASNKGGIGKTSFAMQISGIMSYIGRRVLLLDVDSQHNLSNRLKLEKSKYYIEDLLLGKCKIEDVLMQPYPDDEKLSNIWVIPSSFKLSLIDKEDTKFNEKYAYILSETLKEVKDSFDFCLCDTSPAPALITNMMAYCFSDYILGIVDMCLDSVKGFQTLTDEHIAVIKEYGKKDIEILGVALNNYDARSNYARTYLEQLQELYGDKFFKSIITTSAIIPQSSAVMLPLIVFEPSSKLTTQYVDLTTEIIRRISQGGKK